MNNVSIKLSEHFSLRELTKNKCENGRWEHSFAITSNLAKTDSNPSCLPQLLGQDAFQFLGREAQLEPIVDSDADAARFFGDDNGDAVALLGDA